jgi:hypothetical protein
MCLKAFAALVLIVMAETEAKGYADPGSGVLLWQVLASGFVVILFYARRILRRGRSLLRGWRLYSKEVTIPKFPPPPPQTPEQVRILIGACFDALAVRGSDVRGDNVSGSITTPHATRRVALALFSAAFILRAVIAWKAGYFNSIEPQMSEMTKIAYSVAETGQFADPYAIPTGPTAHTMPLYPLFQALIFKLFGTGLGGEAVKVLSACAACGLRPVLILFAARALRLSAAAGLIAAAVSVFHIGALQTEIRGGWDQPWLALGLIGLTWRTVVIWQEGHWKTGIPWGYGLAWGLAVLAYASFLPLLLTWLAFGAFAHDRRFTRQYLTAGAVVLGLTAAALLPWTWRNYRTFGAPVATRSNFGLELWYSNHPEARYDMSANLLRIPHPSLSPGEARKVAELGELAYNTLRRKQALEWIGANPAQFATLTLHRGVAWWFPPAPPLPRRVLNAVFTVAAFIGLALVWRTDRVTGAVFLATWLSFPLLYYFLQWTSRYRVPMEWQMVIAASVSIHAVWTLLDRRPPRGRRALETPRVRAARTRPVVG